jgi:hypothetical protein
VRLKIKNKALLAALAIAFQVNAEVVTVTGYGQDYNQSLTNAKIAALEKVAGTFIISDTSWKTDETVFEQIKQYNGGVIKSYDIIKSSEHEVTIKADVDVNKDNRILFQSNSIDPKVKDELASSIDNYNKKRAIINELDNPKKAFFVKTGDMQFKPQGQFVNIKIDNQMLWQPKWISDVESFTKLSGNEGSTHTNVTERISAGLLNKVMTINPIAAIIGSAAYVTVNKPAIQKEDPMVCFVSARGKDIDECYESAGGFNNMLIYPNMKVEVSALDSNGRSLYKNIISIANNSMFDNYYPGETKKQRFGYNRTFNQPTVVVYKEAVINFSININIDNNIAKNVDKFLVRII